jgi:hypothetical protein
MNMFLWDDSVDLNHCAPLQRGQNWQMALFEHQPGGPAPGTGEYEELNVFGTPTGRVAVVDKDEELPEAARGFSWRALGDRPVAEIRANAAEYRRMAETARTPGVRESLRKLAERFDRLANQRERSRNGPG